MSFVWVTHTFALQVYADAGTVSNTNAIADIATHGYTVGCAVARANNTALNAPGPCAKRIADPSADRLSFLHTDRATELSPDAISDVFAD